MKIVTTLLALVMTSAFAVAQTTTTEQTTTTTPAVVQPPATTTTTTTTSTGTIHEYTPGSTFIVKETTGPVNYRYGDSVTYVTKSGTVLTQEQVKTRIRVGAPVSVHYATQGDARIVQRVVVDDDDDDDDDK